MKLDRNAETKQILLSGMGQVHIEATAEKVKRKFNVEVVLDTPKVPYRETIKKKVRVQGRHKKQTGGHGQFGDCWIQVEPLPRGTGFEFVDAEQDDGRQVDRDQPSSQPTCRERIVDENGAGGGKQHADQGPRS